VFCASAGLYFLHQAGGGGFRLISLSVDSVPEQSGNRLVCSAPWDIDIKDNIDIKDKNAIDFWLFLAASYCCSSFLVESVFDSDLMTPARAMATGFFTLASLLCPSERVLFAQVPQEHCFLD